MLEVLRHSPAGGVRITAIFQFFQATLPPEDRVQYEHISSDQHLRDYCEVLASAEIIAFVADPDGYRVELIERPGLSEPEA